MIAAPLTRVPRQDPHAVRAAATLTLPSGPEAYLQEVLRHDGEAGATLRFRFVAGGFSPDDQGLEDVQADLEFLCREVALPRAAGEVARVIISLADREVEFGVVTPSARQVFEVFSVADGTCIWEFY